MKAHSLFVTLALLCAGLAPTGFAQNAPVPSRAVCNGVYNNLRISEIKPGSMDHFMEAVSAHQAWYRSHGYPDIIFAARVILRDPKTNVESYSDSEMVTYHYSRGPVPMSSHDAAWNAYVKMYNESSSIKEAILQCVPAIAAPVSLK